MGKNCLKSQKERRRDRLEHMKDTWIFYKYTIYRMILYLITFILLPIALLFSDYGDSLIQVLKKESLITGLIIIILPLYIYMYIKYVHQGFLALYDLYTNNIITVKMRYIDTRVSPHKWIEFDHHNKPYFRDRVMLKILVEMDERAGILLSSYYHRMVKNETYTITCGCKSVIVHSIKSEFGEEMLLLDVK